MAQITLDEAKIRALCGKYHIRRLALFGSVLRPDFGPDSDVDVLVQFGPDAAPTLLTLSRIEDELRGILGREVDLVNLAAVEQSRNYIRRKELLSSLETVYAA